MGRKKKEKKKMTYAERSAQIRQQVFAKRDAALAAIKNEPVHSCPIDVNAILDTTKFEGKTIKKWDALISKREERKDGEFKIVDLTDLPPWVSFAVDAWRRNGSPTIQTKIVETIKELEEKAKKLESFAALDQSEAAKLTASTLSPGIRKSNQPAADKKLVQANKKLVKASEIREEIQKLQKKLENE